MGFNFKGVDTIEYGFQLCTMKNYLEHSRKTFPDEWDKNKEAALQRINWLLTQKKT